MNKISRIDEIKNKYQHLIEKRYTQEFLEIRAKHIEDAMTKKVYVVCDNQEISTTVEKDNEWIASAAWTISTDPKSEGWETDGGESGYGLYPEIAEYYAMCINDYQALLSRLEIAVDALINVEQAIEEIVHEDGQTLNWDEVKTTLEDYVHESIKKIRS